MQLLKTQNYYHHGGMIMAHAGFPNGTGKTAYEIAENLKKDTDEDRHLIIE